MTKKKLNKKLIVVANQQKLTESERIQNSKDKVNAQIEFPTIVSGIDPAPAAVQTILTGIDANVNKRNLLLEEAMGLTETINADLDKVNNIFVDKWAHQIQDSPGIDLGKVKQLKFYVKGIYDGQAEPVVKVSNSHPQLDDLIKVSHLKHILNMVNSTTKKIALPEDAEGIEVYSFIGPTPPADYKDMKYLGTAEKGKFTVTFTEEEMGRTIWYFAIYIPRKKGTLCEIAAKVKAVII
jgi:hypothetical protein